MKRFSKKKETINIEKTINPEDIKLSVTRDFFDLPSNKEKKEIILKQNGKCAFCGIDINKFGRFHNHKELGILGLCSICYHSQHIELLNSEKDGHIAMIDSLNQLELITLTRTIELIKRLEPEEYSEDIDCSSIIRMLIEEGINNSEIYFAEGSSDVELIAQTLSNLSDSDYERRDVGLYTMKWLPNYTSFEKELDYWFELMMKDESSNYHPLKWESMMQQMRKKKGE